MSSMKNSQILIEKTLNLHLGEAKRKNALKYCIINSIFLFILIFDIYKTSCSYDLIFQYIELAACFIILLSFIKNIITYIYYTFFNEEIECENEEQKILLNLKSSNSILKKSQSKKDVVKQDSIGNEMFNANSIRNLSWQSYGEPNSMNLSQHNSWAGVNNSFASFDSTMHSNDLSQSFQSPNLKFSKSEFIMNRSKMDEFLSDVNDREKKVTSAIEAHNNMAISSFNSFWGFDVNGFVSSLKNLTYQLSPYSKQSSKDESFSTKKDEENSEVIRQISANKLSNYVTNVKMWIHKTILEPLVNAINETDLQFEQRGFTDMKLGLVGIERLKKIASSNQHLIMHIPTLPKLIPFLELTTNQEFLVQRLKELGKGSCLKNFKFSSDTYDMSAQNEHLPNDAAIIFHLFCTYLDSQLQPIPDFSRPFFNRYVIVGDPKKTSVEHIVKEATKNKAKCAILCSNLVTPKFNFVTDKIHGSNRNDRNNLFYVIIQFLFHLKADGNMLETVSLSKSGLNLINVIED